VKKSEKLTKAQKARRKYNREYRRKHKQQMAKKDHENYIKNRERILKRQKKYNEEHKEAISKRKRRHWRENRIRNVKKGRKYYIKNRELILKKKQEYQRKNSKILSKRKLKYILKRFKTDMNFKLKMKLRNRIYIALRGNAKRGSAVRDLGCTIEFLKQYLESKFYGKMTWNNWGKVWELDHKKALWKFDLTDRKQFLQAVNYKNLQPLTVSDHRKKSRKEHEQRKAALHRKEGK
jgi:hypothetical protein